MDASSDGERIFSHQINQGDGPIGENIRQVGITGGTENI